MDQLVETKKRLFRHQRNLNKYVASNQYFKVFKDGKCGLVDNTGELLIPIQYMRVRSIRGQLAHNGHGFVRIQTGGENLKGLGRLFDSERTLGTTPGDFNDTGIGLKLHAYILAGFLPISVPVARKPF